jgi:tetratricopeptide (TPR) repeat protein
MPLHVRARRRPPRRHAARLSCRAQAQMYAQAAACYEEVLLHAPASVAAYVQLADVLYTLGPGGGGGHLRAARSHYAAAVELSGGANMRALYGLCAATAALGGKVRPGGGQHIRASVRSQCARCTRDMTTGSGDLQLGRERASARSCYDASAHQQERARQSLRCKCPGTLV